MSVAACAEIVRARDPDRFRATMAAPAAARARLWPLYALNLELARAAWISPEPMICRMRLQWWADTLGAMPEAAPKAHEVARPVHALVEAGVPAGVLVRMAGAREWDTAREPFADEEALWSYLDATAGGLMWAAARALGAPDGAEAAVRDFAGGAGLAAWFCAAAELAERGRRPLPDGGEAAVARLARAGLGRIARARARAATVPRGARPALWPGWQAAGILRQASAEPGRVAAGRLGLSEFARRGTLLWRAASGTF